MVRTVRLDMCMCMCCYKCCCCTLTPGLPRAAAPLFMSSLQFLFQNLIAKTVFKLGLMQRTAGGMGTWGWREYCKQSEWRTHTRTHMQDASIPGA